MSELGNLVHRAQDPEGEIHVYEDARFRYLTFGNQVEQSCLDLGDPEQLVHVHTQAMMLSCLLHPPPDEVLLAGLGGGSLARAMRRARPGATIYGLEQRAAVIEVAREWFGLPADRRFHIVQAEAGAYLEKVAASFDLILSDLYLAEGMDPCQTTLAYLQLAHDRLQPDGILVVNQWASEHTGNREGPRHLATVFGDRVLHLHVQGGNIISFAFRGELPHLQRNAFFEQALRLGLRLQIPLARHARNLWRQSAETLGVGRFRSRQW